MKGKLWENVQVKSTSKLAIKICRTSQVERRCRGYKNVRVINNTAPDAVNQIRDVYGHVHAAVCRLLCRSQSVPWIQCSGGPTNHPKVLFTTPCYYQRDVSWGENIKKLCYQPSGTCLIGCFHQMFVCRVRGSMLSFVREKDDHIKPTPRKPEFRLRSSEGCEQRITPCDSGMVLY
jgi:hypothetical protein